MNSSNTIWKNSGLILLAFFLFKCKNINKIKESNEEVSEWGEVNIDPEIREDSIYTELDKQEEILSAFEEKDSFTRKTSAVAYYSNGQRDPKSDYYARFNNCHAQFFLSDTLSINIGINSGFVASGFSIRYKDNKFNTQPYY